MKGLFKYLRKAGNFLAAYVAFTVFLVLIIPFAISAFKSKVINKDSVLLLKIDQGPIPETDPVNLMAQLKPQITMRQIRNVLEDAKNNPFIKGILLEVYTHKIGFAHAEEIRDLLAEFKKNGKFVYTYTDTFGDFPSNNATTAYYLASISDRIYMQPTGALNFGGLVIEKYFAKDFLKDYQIQIDVQKQKEHKAFLDWVLFQKFSEPVRENLSKLLSDVMKDFMRDIADGRKKTVTEVDSLLRSCPMTDNEANELGYVDFLTHKHAVYKGIKEVHANQTVKSERKIVPVEKYPLKPKKGKNKVAIIYCVGAIKRQNMEQSPMFDESLTDKYAERMVKRAVKRGCKGIILRVDSPGGDAIASETIYGALAFAKEKGLKIVVSMGNVAASGGYWISTAADKIVAMPTTITGSIGVIGARIVTEKLWNKHGINWDHIAEGEGAPMYLTSTQLTESQKERVYNNTRDIYLKFVKKVANARGKSFEDVDQIAGGQVWTGRTAKQFGLVDELGSISKAKSEMEMLLNTKDIGYMELPEGGISEFFANLTQENDLSLAARCISAIYKAAISMIKSEQQTQLKHPYIH